MVASSSSSEFVALCQSQVRLLTQSLGALSTVVYLAEVASGAGGPALVPLVAYPEAVDPWSGLTAELFEASREDLAVSGELADSLAADSSSPLRPTEGEAPPGAWPHSETAPGVAANRVLPAAAMAVPPAVDADDPGEATYPLVLPLSYDGVVLGMLVSQRQRQPWAANDYQLAEQVAATLAIACVMDHRNQWLQRQLTQHRLTQADQSETFHDLLHQFRNPLTALQTFGKLMVKRLPPEDGNRPIAEGIVRESRRLQDLAQHFDDAVAFGDEALAPAAPPPGLLLPQGRSRLTAADGPLSPLADGAVGGELESGWEGMPTQGHGLGRSLTVVPGSLAAVALPLLESTQPLAEEKGLHLVHHIPAPLPQVWLDPAALGEVLHNLLDNALKYAPAGALVWMTAGLVQHLDGQTYHGIAVGDTGWGIPAADQAQLFQRYFRGVQAQGNIPGSGLGLAIVLDLVQGMGGHIDVISPIQGSPWLPPEAKHYPTHPGVLFVVWLRAV